MCGGKTRLQWLPLTGVLLVASTLQAQHSHSGGGQGASRQAPPRQERSIPRPQQNEGRGGPPAYQRATEQRATPRNQPRYDSRTETRYVPQPEPRVMPRPPENVPRPGHSGNWLNQSRNVPRAQQEKALESDPQFRRLPPQRQQQLRQRLQRFNSLQPQQQDRITSRMETWEHLTPQQKQTARGVYQQMQKLPPGRRDMVSNAIRELRQLPSEQRREMLNSPRYRNMFTPQERNMLDGITQLPLAPSNQGDTGPR